MVWLRDLHEKGTTILDSYLSLLKLRTARIYHCGRLSKMDIWTVWVFLWTYLSCNIVASLSKIACRDGADGSLTRSAKNEHESDSRIVCQKWAGLISHYDKDAQAVTVNLIILTLTALRSWSEHLIHEDGKSVCWIIKTEREVLSKCEITPCV